MFKEIDYFARQLLNRGNDVGQPSLDRHTGHAVELGGGGCLNEYRTGLFLDRPQTERAVRSHAGKNDSDAFLVPIIGQRAEKEIDGQTQPARRGGFE